MLHDQACCNKSEKTKRGIIACYCLLKEILRTVAACGTVTTLVNVYVDLLVHVFTRIAGTS